MVFISCVDSFTVVIIAAVVYFVVEEGMDVNRGVCDADAVVDVESIQKITSVLKRIVIK